MPFSMDRLCLHYHHQATVSDQLLPSPRLEKFPVSCGLCTGVSARKPDLHLDGYGVLSCKVRRINPISNLRSWNTSGRLVSYKATCVPSSNLGTSISWNATEKYLVEEQNDQEFVLKERARELAPKLNGTCIYLIGMMGSGKSTVGKLLADALEYNFFDSDKLIEDAAGGMTVAQFFKQKDEQSFRNAETQVLKQLFDSRHSVISTGGGIVVSSINWKYLRSGITVWLDVPLEELAERVVSVGTHTRPLLGTSEGDSPYSQAFSRLSSIFEFREPFYSDADVVVSLERLALKLQYQHVRDITPTVISIQVLEEIDKFLCSQGLSSSPCRSPITASHNT